MEFPQTEHAFDLLLPRYSPPAQAALYDLDRFLALMAAAQAEPDSNRWSPCHGIAARLASRTSHEGKPSPIALARELVRFGRVMYPLFEQAAAT